MNQISIELLSPAKDADFGIAAVNFGADAVYIGAPKFGARAAARNSITDIEKLCSYAHRFHAKVYVALNTILFDDELAEAERMIHHIYKAGADALIVQDMGILEMDLPPIVLHASTQTHNYDIRRIKFLQDVGFSRVVLARELSLKQIEEIKTESDIELEAFVHGALCVSFSGQCYMSAYQGSRSGNRGECAQPCRLKYDLFDSKQNKTIENTHLLSLRDMNRSAHLIRMMEAGVTTFKIEGRLKDISYVKNITAFYRKKIDEIVDGKSQYTRTSIGICHPCFTPDPEKSFNRGFTDYGLLERTEKISALSPKSLGKPMGRVSNSGWNYIKIVDNPQISNGDGLCWFDVDGELKGFAVQNSESGKIFSNNPINIPIGTQVYRNLDVVFNRLLSVAESSRRIPVDMVFSETETGIELRATTSGGEYTAVRTIDMEKTEARDIQKANDTVETQLCKTGASVYDIRNLEKRWGSPLFVPMGELNRLRRETLEELDRMLGSAHIRIEKKIFPTDVPYFDKQLDYRANIANALSEQFYKRHGVEKTEPAFEISTGKKGEILMTTKLCLRYEQGICPTYQKHGAADEPQFIAQGTRFFRLEYDCRNCMMHIIA